MSKMFDIQKIISGMEEGHELELFSMRNSELSLTIKKIDNSSSPFDLIESIDKEILSKPLLRKAKFSLLGIEMIRWGDEYIQDMVLYKYKTDPKTHESLGRFDPDGFDIELFLLEHQERYFCCGLEGFFFEVHESEVETALLKLPVQRTLQLQHLKEIPEGMEQYI